MLLLIFCCCCQHITCHITCSFWYYDSLLYGSCCQVQTDMQFVSCMSSVLHIGMLVLKGISSKCCDVIFCLLYLCRFWGVFVRRIFAWILLAAVGNIAWTYWSVGYCYKLQSLRSDMKGSSCSIHEEWLLCTAHVYHQSCTSHQLSTYWSLSIIVKKK